MYLWVHMYHKINSKEFKLHIYDKNTHIIFNIIIIKNYFAT